jgi:hypothetical protein
MRPLKGYGQPGWGLFQWQDRHKTWSMEKQMEFAPELPAWLTWIAASGVGVLAIAVLARSLEAVFDLDPS